MPGSTEERLAALLAAIDAEIPAAVELRHALHRDPELAHSEVRTSALVADALPVASEPAAGTGLIARVGAGPGRAVAVRAELDGLAVRERTGAPFSATGQTMHACGHDVHMAALVALTRAVHGLGEAAAPLLAVLQPSEEAYPSGALALAEGELGAAAPAAIVAAHIHPQLPWGTVGLDPGPVNASCDAFAVVVEGEQTHGAYPHLGRDPVLAVAEIVTALHARAGRLVDPLAATSLTVAMLEAGTAVNVVPATATARGTFRSHDVDARERLRGMIGEVAEGVAAAHGCRARVEVTRGEPALVNDAAIVARGRELLGGASLQAAAEWRSCGSDDLAFLGAVAPLAMAFVGLEGAPGFTQRPLHHPELLPPDEAVRALARVQAILYLAAAERGGG